VSIFATQELKILSQKKKNYGLQFSNGIILKTSNQETQFAGFLQGAGLGLSQHSASDVHASNVLRMFALKALLRFNWSAVPVPQCALYCAFKLAWAQQ